MATVEDILKQSGLSDAEIKALDQKLVTGFTTILSTATAAEQTAAAAKAEAETAQRAQEQLYRDQIAPALDGWANEKATLEATVEFYKKQNESARGSGFIPKDAPGYTPPANGGDPGARDPGSGRFVPGGNPVPGSPAYMTMEQGLTALSNAQWVMAEHMRLFGAPMPDDFEAVVKEAAQQRLSFRDYASRKYKFAEKRDELTAAKQKEHDDKIRAETKATVDKEWAERVGNNPNVRIGVPSSFDKIHKGVTSGQMKDPLSLSPEERREATRQYIQKDIAENTSGSVH